MANSTDGTHIEKKVLPEFDGEQWNDVLRLHEVEDYPPMPLIVRVYAVEP